MDEQVVAIVAGLIFALAGAAALWQHYLGPRRRRAAFLADMRARAWPAVGRDATEWRRFLGIARPGPQEFTTTGRHTEQHGPMTVGYEETRTEKDFEARAFRDPAARHPRLVAVAEWSRQRHTRSTLQHTHHNAGLHRLWIGELRPLPVTERVTAYDFFQALFGEPMKAFAEGRGVAVERLDHGTAPSADDASAAVRSVLERDGAGRALQASVFLSPEGWVLELPQARGLPRLSEALALADAISAVLDRAGR